MKRIMMATLAMVFAFTAFAADKVTVTHWYWADNPKYSATMQ